MGLEKLVTLLEATLPPWCGKSILIALAHLLNMVVVRGKMVSFSARTINIFYDMEDEEYENSMKN